MNPVLHLTISVCSCAATTALAQSPREWTNSLGMKMVAIAPGSFQMGSVDGEFDEQPVHRVRITQSFSMAATEVNNAQYERFDSGHKT
ncbi:MAG: SUMF1/EgtB/PvdO family nonheme iron enzyme, partial [Thermoguttaceae bacterium]